MLNIELIKTQLGYLKPYSDAGYALLNKSLFLDNGKMFISSMDFVVEVPIDWWKWERVAVEYQAFAAAIETCSDNAGMDFDGSVISIKSGGHKSKLKVVYPEDMISTITEIISFDGIHMPTCVEFIVNDVEIACSCVGKDSSYPLLQCLHITSEYMETCNNSQLIRVRDLPWSWEEDILVKAKQFSTMVHQMDTIGLTNEWIVFEHHDSKTSLVDVKSQIRRISGKYPSLDKILNSEGVEIELPEEAGKVVTAAKKYGLKGDDTVIIAIGSGMAMFNMRWYGGQFSQKYDCEYNGELIKFKLPLSKFNDLLKRADDRSIWVGSNVVKIYNGEEWVFATSLIA
jgi:hypothetical protein